MKMFEKVSPAHPDLVADRIAGAIVDLAYSKHNDPKVAVEVLIGHGECMIINETSQHLEEEEIKNIVSRITQDDLITVKYVERKQDSILAHNQDTVFRCGDNGIFAGCATSKEEQALTNFAKFLWDKYKADGKYIYSEQDKTLIVCQSNANSKELKEFIIDGVLPYKTIKADKDNVIVNPLGDWSGGLYVDSGVTGRKLGSDMGRAVTGGSVCNKDLSKADVSVNIYLHIKAELAKKLEKRLDRFHSMESPKLTLYCAIGQTELDGKPYSQIVEIARQYISEVGGFEKFAEWGLIRPIECDVNYKKYARLVYGDEVAKLIN